MAEYTPTNWKNGDKITAEKLNKIEAQLAAISTSNIPAGLISAYHGTVDSIPAGQVVCDGTNGTPDLRDKFVLGAGTTHTVGEQGGAKDVTLTYAHMPAHQHRIFANGTNDITQVNAQPLKCEYKSPSESQLGYPANACVIAGGSQPHENMPPYYSLLYIMKT